MARHGLESVRIAITRRHMHIRFDFLEAYLALIERPLVYLKNVGP